MATSDDYSTVNDCNAATGFTLGGTGTLAVNTGGGVDGGNCLDVDVSATPGSPVTATYRYALPGGVQFRLDQEDFLIWFFYIKGKGSAVLTDTDSTVTLRIYCGALGNDDWIEFYFGGDNDLQFGWQSLGCSGLNYDASSVTWQDSDITQNVTNIELRLEYAANTSNPPPLRIDFWRSGTKIVLGSGAGNVGFDELISYDATNFLGVIETIGDVGVILRCGLDIGNGTAGANEANLVDAGKFILFFHFSEEVKHNLTVTNNSSFRGGTLEVGADDNYPVDGLQLVVSEVRTRDGTLTSESGYSDLIVQEGGAFELYDSKLFRWKDIDLGVVGQVGAGGQITISLIDVDSCETINFNQTNLEATRLDIHDNRGRTDASGVDNCGSITAQPDVFEDVTVHDCEHGIYFRDTVTVNEYKARDNVSFDLGILEGETATIIDGEFDADRILRQAT